MITKQNNVKIINTEGDECVFKGWKIANIKNYKYEEWFFHEPSMCILNVSVVNNDV